MNRLVKLIARRNQKVVKPQFFESYKTQRDNLDLLDAAASYMTKKAVTASVKLSERPLSENDEGVWGGMPTKTVLATELVPMMVKIQNLSSRKCLSPLVEL
jgi:cell cycle checkpoint protein